MRKYNYIYKITNLLNNKIYIGKHSTDNLEDGYMGSGVVLKKAKEKYGIDNFTKEIVAITDNKDDLNQLEKLYISMFNSTDKNVGYNIAPGGEGFDLGNEPWNKGMKGIHLSPNTEFKPGMNPWNKDKHLSEETKIKLSEYNKLNPNSGVFKKGHKPSVEVRSKINIERQYINENNEIIWMRPSLKNRWHPDWKEVL